MLSNHFTFPWQFSSVFRELKTTFENYNMGFIQLIVPEVVIFEVFKNKRVVVSYLM